MEQNNSMLAVLLIRVSDGSLGSTFSAAFSGVDWR